MRIHNSVRAVGMLVALAMAACSAPSTGSGVSSTPTASPAQSAVTQPSASPSAAPVTAYLDDRSSAEQVVRSYYDAIGRRQYLRAYGYWEPSTTLPAFDVFAKGFETTTSVQVELGTVGGSPGAGQLYWSVPAVVLSTTTTGTQAFVGCYTLHLARPEIQAAPPFKPIAIQTGQLQSAVIERRGIVAGRWGGQVPAAGDHLGRDRPGVDLGAGAEVDGRGVVEPGAGDELELVHDRHLVGQEEEAAVDGNPAHRL